MNRFTKTGFLRLPQIIGDKNANLPIEPIIPVSKSTWWAGCYPQPCKIGARCTAWTAESIRAHIESVGVQKS